MHVSAWGTEIVQSSVLGQPCLVFDRRRRHVADLLLDGRVFADRDYLISDARRVTFAEHERAVAAASELLRTRGVEPGDRVVLYAANAVAWVVSYWAILNIGAVVVLGNAWWSEDELCHAIHTTEPRLVITDRVRQTRVPNDAELLLVDEVEGSFARWRRAQRTSTGG